MRIGRMWARFGAAACLSLACTNLPPPSEVIPEAKKVEAAAVTLCVVHNATLAGLEPAEALGRFCSKKEQLQPWIDHLLSQQCVPPSAVADAGTD